MDEKEVKPEERARNLMDRLEKRYRRPLTSGETSVVLFAFTTGFEPDVIERAFETTCLTLGRTNYRYTEKILENWAEKGWLTMKDYEAANNPKKAQPKNLEEKVAKLENEVATLKQDLAQLQKAFVKAFAKE